MDKERLELNLGMIKDAIEEPVQGTDIIGTIEKMQQLSSMMGLCAECQKFAKKFVYDKQQKAFEDAEITKDMSPTMIKLKLEVYCADESLLYLYSERLSAAIVHCSDALRTIISLHKEELRLSMNQPS